MDNKKKVTALKMEHHSMDVTLESRLLHTFLDDKRTTRKEEISGKIPPVNKWLSEHLEYVMKRERQVSSAFNMLGKILYIIERDSDGTISTSCGRDVIWKIIGSTKKQRKFISKCNIAVLNWTIPDLNTTYAIINTIIKIKDRMNYLSSIILPSHFNNNGLDKYVELLPGTSKDKLMIDINNFIYEYLVAHDIDVDDYDYDDTNKIFMDIAEEYFCYIKDSFKANNIPTDIIETTIREAEEARIEKIVAMKSMKHQNDLQEKRQRAKTVALQEAASIEEGISTGNWNTSQFLTERNIGKISINIAESKDQTQYALLITKAYGTKVSRKFYIDKDGGTGRISTSSLVNATKFGVDELDKLEAAKDIITNKLRDCFYIATVKLHVTTHDESIFTQEIMPSSTNYNLEEIEAHVDHDVAIYSEYVQDQINELLKDQNADIPQRIATGGFIKLLRDDYIADIRYGIPLYALAEVTYLRFPVSTGADYKIGDNLFIHSKSENSDNSIGYTAYIKFRTMRYDNTPSMRANQTLKKGVTLYKNKRYAEKCASEYSEWIGTLFDESKIDGKTFKFVKVIRIV